MRSDTTNNCNNDLSQILEALKSSDKVIYVNFTYIALQNNHGQINFSTVPVLPKTEEEEAPKE